MGTHPQATIEAARLSTRSERCEWCREPRRGGAKPGRFCSPRCRIAASEARRAKPLLDLAESESYLAPRPLPQEPEARRDELKAVAASNNRFQLVVARWLALIYAGDSERALEHPTITSDVREWARRKRFQLEWTKPWIGSLFQCAWFEWTGGLRNSYHRGGNARQVKEWRLTAEGRAAYRAAKELMRCG